MKYSEKWMRTVKRWPRDLTTETHSLTVKYSQMGTVRRRLSLKDSVSLKERAMVKRCCWVKANRRVRRSVKLSYSDSDSTTVIPMATWNSTG